MQYRIHFSQPLKHLLHISLTKDVSDKDTEIFYLPIWRPGRYEAANYSKNIFAFKVTNGKGQELNWTKKTANQWEIDTKAHQEVNISYSYFAHTMDAGNSWFDEQLIYINFINCMMFTADSLTESCSVAIDIPDSYEIATALDYKNNHFSAQDYYELVDSPLMASSRLDRITYDVAKVKFNIWIYGSHDLNKDKMKTDFEIFSLSQIDCFGEFPEQEYHFLLLALPYKFYHGVEHASSTVICLGPGNELSSTTMYSSLLGVSSHELFHAWNIIKIRPKEMMPYDFSKPLTFATGYVAEGFTTYYGDLFLSRSHVFDTDAYFNELNTIFNRHFWNYGRLNESVMTSSANLWVDGYVAGAPDKKSSIYVEGAMVALCLDLKIRATTNNTRSLDDVMRLLWIKHGKTLKGYSHEDIIAYASDVVDKSLKKFFDDFVEGTHDKRLLLDECLETVGCYIENVPNETLLQGVVGLRTISEDSGLRVVSICPSSPAEELFSINDVIKNINGNKADDLIAGQTNKLIVERFGKELTIEVTIDQSPAIIYYPKHVITKANEASDAQKKAFELWCGHVF